MNKQKLILLFLAFIGGSAVMAMEVIFPRISVIWFGNMVQVWSAMLIGALLSLSLGYWLGSRLVRKGVRLPQILFICYLVAALVFFTLPYWDAVFGMLLSLDVGLGSLIGALLVMLPAVGALAVTSPILVHLLRKVDKNPGSASLVFGVSTIAGVLMILIGGAWMLMDYGISVMCNLTAALLFVNAVCSFLVQLKKDQLD